MIPTNLGQSIAGIAHAEATDAKEKAARANPRRMIRDAYEPTTPVESPEAIRRLKGASEEETHEEREQRPEARDPRASKPPRRLDVEV